MDRLDLPAPCACRWCTEDFGSTRAFYAHHDKLHPGRRASAGDLCPGATGPGVDAKAEGDRRLKITRRLASDAGVSVEAFESYLSKLPRFEIHADCGVAFQNPAAWLSQVSRNEIAFGPPQPRNRAHPGNGSGSRFCEWCGEVLPAFHAGRQVRADVRFCPGGACKQAAHRSRRVRPLFEERTVA